MVVLRLAASVHVAVERGSVWRCLFCYRRAANDDVDCTCFGRLVNVRVERLEFRLVDVKDEQGTLWRLRIAFEHLAEYQRLALALPVFADFSKRTPLRDRQLMFLAKNLVAGGFQEPLSVWRSLYLVHVCEWKLRALGMPVSGRGAVSRTLSLGRCGRNVCRRSRPGGDRCLALAPGDEPSATTCAPWWGGVSAYFRPVQSAVFREHHRRQAPTIRPLPSRPVSTSRSTPCVAVPYYGQFNLDRPELYSDLFFWQQSKLPASSVLVLFSLPQDPLDDGKLSELTRHGFQSLALNAQAVRASVAGGTLTKIWLAAPGTFAVPPPTSLRGAKRLG